MIQMYYKNLSRRSQESQERFAVSKVYYAVGDPVWSMWFGAKATSER